MKLCFTLTMPNGGSWNGKWSGEDNLYARVLTFSSKKSIVKAKKILDTGSFYYRWNDGLGANVSVKEIDGKESRRIKRLSKGFCGYDWMIDSIRQHNHIYADHDEIPSKVYDVCYKQDN